MPWVRLFRSPVFTDAECSWYAMAGIRLFGGTIPMGLPANIHTWNFAKFILIMEIFEIFCRENHSCNGMVFNKARNCVQSSAFS